MNLDLLKKLVRLANNNPNDNEANSAARRVCKMLEECNFNLTNLELKDKQGKTIYQPSQAQQDWIRKQTNQNKTPPGPSQQAVYDEIRKEQERFRREQANKSWYRPYTTTTKTTNNTVLRCTKCGQMVETSFIGRPEVFICNGCIWS